MIRQATTSRPLVRENRSQGPREGGGSLIDGEASILKTANCGQWIVFGLWRRGCHVKKVSYGCCSLPCDSADVGE